MVSCCKQGSKSLGYWIPGTPKNGGGNQDLAAGFPTGKQEIVREMDSCFLTGNPEITKEIQILRQVFQTETQILIAISSPVSPQLILSSL